MYIAAVSNEFKQEVEWLFQLKTGWHLITVLHVKHFHQDETGLLLWKI